MYSAGNLNVESDSSSRRSGRSASSQLISPGSGGIDIMASITPIPFGIAMRSGSLALEQRARVAQALDVVGGEAPWSEGFGGGLAGVLRWGGPVGGCSREAWSGRGLRHASHVEERVAGNVVRVTRRLDRVEHRCEARVGVFEERAPFVARLGEEQRGQPFLLHRPATCVPGLRELGIVGQPELLQETRIELRLDRADSDV